MRTSFAKLQRVQKTKGKAAAAFRLRDTILGSSKSPNDPFVVTDVGSGIELMTPHEIKEAFLNYCVRLLRKSEPSDCYVNHFYELRSLHWQRMSEC